MIFLTPSLLCRAEPFRSWILSRCFLLQRDSIPSLYFPITF